MKTKKYHQKTHINTTKCSYFRCYCIFVQKWPDFDILPLFLPFLRALMGKLRCEFGHGPIRKQNVVIKEKHSEKYRRENFSGCRDLDAQTVTKSSRKSAVVRVKQQVVPPLTLGVGGPSTAHWSVRRFLFRFHVAIRVLIFDPGTNAHRNRGVMQPKPKIKK